MNQNSTNQLDAYRVKMYNEQGDRNFGTCKGTPEQNLKVVENCYCLLYDECRADTGLPIFGPPRYTNLIKNTPQLSQFNKISMSMGLSPTFMLNCLFDYARHWGKRKVGPNKQDLSDRGKITWAIEKVSGLPAAIQGNMFREVWVKERAVTALSKSISLINEHLLQTGATDIDKKILDTDALGICACHRLLANPEWYVNNSHSRGLVDSIEEEINDNRTLRILMHTEGWTFDVVADYLLRHE